MDEAFGHFLSKPVVIDTAGPIVYLGTLVEVNATGLVLENADVHDCRDGHATKEVYVNESSKHGISVNRLRVFIMRSSIMSVSRLADVVEQ